jgi:hypothetical protein
MNRTAIAQKIAKAAASNGGNYIKDGRYTFAVTKIEFAEKKVGACFIAEFRVLEAAATEDGVAPNAVGSTCSMVQPIDKFDSAAGNVKSFICALAGADPKTVTEDEFVETLDELAGEANPGRGMLIKCETYRKLTKKGDKTLVLPRWEHVSQDEKSIEATRKKLDATEKAA